MLPRPPEKISWLEYPNEEASQSGSVYGVLALSLLLLVAVGMRRVVRARGNALPYNVVVVFLGVCIGLFFCLPMFKDHWNMIMGAPHVMITVYMPVHIVSSLYRIDYDLFFKCLPHTLLITIMGVTFCPLALAVVVSYVLHPQWSYLQGLLATILTLPIEPLHVIRMLQDLAKYRLVETILDAEAVLIVIPIFMIFDLLLSVERGRLATWPLLALYLTRSIGISVTVGAVLGILQTRLMVWFYDEPLSTVCISLSVSFTTYIVAAHVFVVSGELALVLCVCIVVSERHKFSNDVDESIQKFWAMLHFFCELVTLIIATIGLTIYIVKIYSPTYLYGTLIFYVAALTIRFLRYVMLSPIINRTANSINMRSLIVLSWSDVKGTISLTCLVFLITFSTLPEMHGYMFEAIFYNIATLFVNCTTIHLILSGLGFKTLSKIQHSNMSYWMNYIISKRVCVLEKIHGNRYLSNANWAVVKRSTLIRHPYAGVVDKKKQAEVERQQEEGYMWAGFETGCADCPTDVPYDATEEELKEFLKETQMKVIRAIKVFMLKQESQGAISKKCMRLVLCRLEGTLETNQPLHYIFECRNLITPNKFLVFVRNILAWMSKRVHYEPPPTNGRRVCFFVTMHIAYDFILYVITLINAWFAIWHPVAARMKTGHHALFMLVYLGDFGARLMGLSQKSAFISGVRPYFRLIWHIFDGCVLALHVMTLFIVQPWEHHEWIVNYCLPGYPLLAAVRLVRVFALINRLTPYAIAGIDYRINVGLYYGYVVGSALMRCTDEMLATMNHIAEMKLIRDVYMREIRTEYQDLMRLMDSVQRERSFIAVTLKTKMIMNIALQAMCLHLHDMQSSGFLCAPEHAYIAKLMASRLRGLRRMRFLRSSPPRELFKEVPWMTADPSLVEFLFNNVRTVSWDAGKHIMRRGQRSEGVYIIVFGMLRLRYDPGEDHPIEPGFIPIVDFLPTTDFNKMFEENIVSGNTIGELSVLTGRPYDCDIFADAPTQAYWLTTDILLEACAQHPDPSDGLEARMWKVCAMNLAVAIMMREPRYQAHTQDMIKMRLGTAFVPNVDAYKVMAITDKMEDVLLIEGVVGDSVSGAIFVAPAMIPRTVQKMLLPRSSFLNCDDEMTVRMMVVPAPNMEPAEIMQRVEALSECAVVTRRSLTNVEADRKSRLKTFQLTVNLVSINKESDTVINYVGDRPDLKVICLDSDGDEESGKSMKSRASRMSTGSRRSVTQEGSKVLYLLKNRRVIESDIFEPGTDDDDESTSEPDGIITQPTDEA